MRDNHGQVRGMKKDIYFKLQTATIKNISCNSNYWKGRFSITPELKLLLIDLHCGSNRAFMCLNVVLNLWAFNLHLTLFFFLSLLSQSMHLLKLSPHRRTMRQGEPVLLLLTHQAPMCHSPLSSSSPFAQGRLTCAGRGVDKMKASLKIHPQLDAQSCTSWQKPCRCTVCRWDWQKAKSFPLPRNTEMAQVPTTSSVPTVWPCSAQPIQGFRQQQRPRSCSRAGGEQPGRASDMANTDSITTQQSSFCRHSENFSQVLALLL